MSVEQTTQLIQLTLNSVLMTVACALLLSRISLRQTAVEEQLKTANRQYGDVLSTTQQGNIQGFDRSSRVLQIKKHLRQLQYRYKILRYGVLAETYALLCAIASTLALALRALIDLELLVPLSLVVFVVGVGLVLLGVGFTLIDLHTVDRPLWEEVTRLLGATRGDEVPRTEWQHRSNVADRFMRRHTSTVKPSSRARVS